MLPPEPGSKPEALVEVSRCAAPVAPAGPGEVVYANVKVDLCSPSPATCAGVYPPLINVQPASPGNVYSAQTVVANADARSTTQRTRRRLQRVGVLRRCCGARRHTAPAHPKRLQVRLLPRISLASLSDLISCEHSVTTGGTAQSNPTHAGAACVASRVQLSLPRATGADEAGGRRGVRCVYAGKPMSTTIYSLRVRPPILYG